MAGDPRDGNYRAMLEENGMPKLGASASTLGLRKNKDITADLGDVVRRPAFQPWGKNGLSCSRRIAALPQFALPAEWGGLNDRTVVWKIEEADLGPGLVAGDDAVSGLNEHVSIGPSASMQFDEFVRAIQATRPYWKKVIKS